MGICTNRASVYVQPSLVFELPRCPFEQLSIGLVVHLNVYPQLIACRVVRYDAQFFRHSPDIFRIHPVDVDIDCDYWSIHTV